jgi:hypothetical protein
MRVATFAEGPMTRLINSDGQIVDAKVIAKDGGNAASANNYGVPSAFLWVNTAISCLALAFAVVGLVVFGIFYRELEREVRIYGQKQDDMRASMIARDINPNNHDVQDVGGKKP